MARTEFSEGGRFRIMSSVQDKKYAHPPPSDMTISGGLYLSLRKNGLCGVAETIARHP
jgi:hypothetical protein